MKKILSKYSNSFLILLLVTVAVVFSAAGVFYFNSRLSNFTKEKNQQLSAIAEYKIQQIVQWKNERFGDARTLHANILLKRSIKKFLTNKDDQSRVDIGTVFNSIIVSYGYKNILLLNNEGEVVFSVGNFPTLYKDLPKKEIKTASTQRQIIFTNFYFSSNNAVRLGVIIPIELKNRLEGIIFLEIDPDVFLYPLIQEWPTPSKSSESLLVLKDNDDVLFINELRHKKNTALKYRIPISDEDLPASMAIRGYKGIVEGQDYRDITVTAYISAVEGTPWFIVTKIDKDEVYQPIAVQMYSIGLMTLLVIAVLSLIIFILFRRQQIDFARKNLQLESEKLAIVKHYEQLNKFANDLIILTDNNHVIKDANERAVNTLGFSKEELPGMNFRDLLIKNKGKLDNISKEGIVFETYHKNKLGKIIPFEISTRLIEIENYEYIQHIIRDISERKAYESNLEKVSRLYATLSQINQMIISVESKEELFNNSCDILSEYGRFNIVVLGLFDNSGELNQYAKRVYVPEGADPEVFEKIKLDREISNNILRESGEALVKLETEKKVNYFLGSYSGIPSCASAVMRNDEKLMGIITVCSIEDNFFNVEETQLLAEISLDINHGLKHIFSEAKRIDAERKLKYNERSLGILYEMTRMAKREESEIIQYALEEAVKMTDSKIGYFHFLNEDQVNLELFTWTDSVMKECKTDSASHYPLEHAGVWADCVKLKRPVFHNDYNSLSDKKGLPEGHVNLIRHMSVPIVEGETVIGVGGVGNKDTNYDQTDVKQLELFMSEMWKILKQKRAEFEVRKLSTAIDQSSATIVITDKDGIIQYGNKGLSVVTGYSPEEVIGQNASLFKSGKTPNAVYKGLWETILSGNVWSGEILNRRKNGELFWEFSSIAPITGNDGEIKNFIAVKEDITNRKKMMDELIAAKENAERSEQLKSEFLAQISHEIRTPLNVILNFSFLLKSELEDQLPDDLDSAFDSIDEASKRIIRTVDLILNMSQMQTGTYNPIISEVDLVNDILKPLVHQFKIEADKKEIDLIIYSAVEEAVVISDRYGLTQIFSNLIDNAIKYTKTGNVTIDIEQNRFGGIDASVIDTGIGISKNYLPSLFDPFSQEEQGYSRKYDGTGLGLSLVKRYCEINNINIEVESEKNRGTTFKLSLSARQGK